MKTPVKPAKSPRGDIERPTQEEIREACLRIQQSWTVDEERSRRLRSTTLRGLSHPPDWRPQIIPTADVVAAITKKRSN